MNLLVGNNLAGTVSNLADYGANYVSWHETNGAPGFDFYYNITDVPSSTTTFNVNIYDNYTGNAGHIIDHEIYNFTSASWIITDSENGEQNGVWDWDNFTLSDTAGVIQNGVVMLRVDHVSSGNQNHLYSLDYIELTALSSQLTTNFSVPTSSGSFTIAAGSSVYLYSPVFPSASTLYSGSYLLDLWASATSSGTMSVSFVAVNSSNNTVATAASGDTETIGTTESEVKTSFSGSQITVPSDGRLIANISNPTASGNTFTIYWGSGQPTNYQTPADYDYVLAISNSASSSYAVSLLTYTSSSTNRLTNLTISIYSPNTKEIIVTDGAFTQSSGSTVTILS